MFLTNCYKFTIIIKTDNIVFPFPRLIFLFLTMVFHLTVIKFDRIVEG